MTDSAQEEAVQVVYDHAIELMRNGLSDEEIEENLVAQGLGTEAAQIVVTNLVEARSEQFKKAGLKNMGFGALWCVGGLVVTGATYSAASSGGGTYIVTWGAIVFGAIQFIQGLIQYCK